MVAFKETAEEQLLRMIEGPQGTTLPSQPNPAPDPKDFFKKGWFLKGIPWLRRGSPFSFRKKSSGDPFLQKLKFSSGLFWVVLLGLGGYVVYDLIMVAPRQPKIGLSTSDSQAENEVPISAKSPLKPLPDLMAQLGQKNPFTGILGNNVVALEKSAKNRLEEMAKNFSLVGIDRGPKPAAIIEGTTPPKTYVVGPGDKLSGGITVKRITPEGVVLGYEGHEVVLQ